MSTAAYPLPDEVKSYKFHIKSADENGTITGYASVFGVTDTDGEVVDKGAFARTLGEPHNKGKIPVLWQHDRTTPIGWCIDAKEDDHGLLVKAQLLMDTEVGRYAYSFVKTGLDVGGNPGISIGFRVPRGGEKIVDGTRHFTEVQLMEWSIATFQACPGAWAIGAKGAVSSDLPLASADRSWDGDGARHRLAKYAGGPDKENVVWTKYRKGFLWFDAKDPENFGSYKLPIADVIDGKLMAVPRGVMAAAGGHGVDSADIPDADKAKIKSTINRYYKRMGKDSPFKEEEMATVVMKDFTQELSQSQALNDHYGLKWDIHKALDSAIEKICKDDDVSLAEKKPMIHKCLDQHAEAMKSWWSKYLDLVFPEDDEPDGDEGDKTSKAGKVISRSTKLKLEKCMGHLKDSMGHSAASHELKTKALGILTDLSNGRYWNDVNPPNPVGQGAGPAGGGLNNPVGDGKSLAENLRRTKENLQKLTGSLKS